MEFKIANSQFVPILLYIPVLHKGYLQFFERYARESSTLWLIGSDLAAKFSTLHTEIRAVDPLLIKKMIEALGIFGEIKIIGLQNIGEFLVSKIITANENVSRLVVKEYFSLAEVVFDTVFLRYDEVNVKSLKPMIYSRQSDDPFDLEMMTLAYNVAEKSSDWWRHVGAVLVKDRKVIFTAHNQSVPSEQMPYIFGNPRDFIEAGTLSQFSDVLHSEKALFAQALKSGFCVNGTDLYTSVFSCPDCSNLIAYSGVKRLFFGSGHASLNGQSVLESQGVELIYVPIRPLT